MSYPHVITSVLRVPLFLKEKEIRFESILHPPAFSAQKRASLLHLSGRYLAKSVLLVARGRFHLAVLPATHQIVMDSLTSFFGERPRLASNDEIAGIFRDCEGGVLTPFGCCYGIPSMLDNAFHPDAPFAFAAHLHVLTLRMLCRDYERIEKPRRLSFARRLL